MQLLATIRPITESNHEPNEVRFYRQAKEHDMRALTPFHLRFLAGFAVCSGLVAPHGSQEATRAPGRSMTMWLFLIAALASGALTARVYAQEMDPKALLGRVNAEIEGLAGFIVRGDAYMDARLPAGQIIEHASQVTLRLRRQPGSIRITNRNTENTKEIFFHDGLLTVYSTKDNLYAQTSIPKGVESMLDYAVNEVGIDSPFLDFVSSNVSDEFLQGADEVRYLGTSLIRNEIFDHIGIRLPEQDVQVWIASKGRPLPGKLVITSKWEGGSPRFVGFLEWETDPDLDDDLFKFHPPEGAVKVEFLLDSAQ